MTEVLSFLRHSLNVLGVDAEHEDTDLNRSKSAPAAPERPNSIPRSALRGKNGPRTIRQSVRFNEGGEENGVKDDIMIGRTSSANDVKNAEPHIHEFDKLVRQLDSQQKAELRECLVQKKFAKGETIIYSGSKGDAIYFIGFGSCMQLGADGRSVLLMAGDYFGEREALKTANGSEKNIFDSILNLMPERKVDVIAGDQGCVVYECSGENFTTIFGQSKELIEMIQSRSKSRLQSLKKV